MSSQNVYLINLETGGNQAYVYSTNKLRDVVGASELLYRTGTLYVKRAVEKVTQKDGKENGHIETIIVTSGKAMLLADSEETAKRFIRAWSEIVTEEAPGVDAVAVYSRESIDLDKPLDRDLDGSFMKAFRDARKRYNFHRMNRPSTLARFQRIPVAASCQHSGEPAASLSREGYPISRSTYAKIEVTRGKDKDIFETRMSGLYPEGMGDIFSREKGLEALEGLGWLGVVHADGNGLGQFFINFDKYVKKLDGDNAAGRNYVDRYRKFSGALEKISQESFKKAVADVFESDKTNKFRADIVPIVVGGDDLTAVMDGKKSVAFAKRYMEHFCQATESCPDVRPLLEAAGLPRLGMCAGICIVKPHFPFSEAYRLAEELTKEAKKIKKAFGDDAMALDFHVLYDSVATSMKEIRGKLAIKETGTTRHMTAKPYAILREQDRERTSQNPEEQKTLQIWRNVHDFEKFLSAVRALRAKKEKEEEKNALLLPSSQSHAVREDLFDQHLETQEAEWRYLMGRYKEFMKEWPCKSLYVEADSAFYTFFLDALESADFMEGLCGDERERNGGKAE
ncbi:MAG: hypothetical protein LBJ22_00005 [Synergistaceae bacterium]|jgi:hypothetical protein|nr:hypothetical protein [Synergistaceae bacterium]